MGVIGRRTGYEMKAIEFGPIGVNEYNMNSIVIDE
ncbi:MAG: hypothetical protein ACI90V_013595 [Bacillariaceae sp.]|jgi:hypothetical protein